MVSNSQRLPCPGVPSQLIHPSRLPPTQGLSDRRARWDFPTPRGTKSSASCIATLSGPLHHPHTSCLEFIITGQEGRKRLPYNWLTGEQKATSVVSFVFCIPAQFEPQGIQLPRHSRAAFIGVHLSFFLAAIKKMGRCSNILWVEGKKGRKQKATSTPLIQQEEQRSFSTELGKKPAPCHRYVSIRVPSRAGMCHQESCVKRCIFHPALKAVLVGSGSSHSATNLLLP